MGMITVGLASNPGREREDNQDALFALATLLPAQAAGGAAVPFGLFAVADGMGGMSDGGTASNMALRMITFKISDRFLTPALAGNSGDGPAMTVTELLKSAIEEASATIFNMANAAGQQSGTTLSLVLLMGRQLTLAHAGDSRIYMAGPDGVELLTTDHTIAARLVELGQMSAEESVDDPQRNRVYRSLGLSARIEPDIASRRFSGPGHIILCSDGLWSLVSGDEMAAVLRDTASPQAAADRLIEIANARGGPDNISVIIVQPPT